LKELQREQYHAPSFAPKPDQFTQDMGLWEDKFSCLWFYLHRNADVHFHLFLLTLTWTEDLEMLWITSPQIVCDCLALHVSFFA
jgi:hypothetical protein